MRIKMKEKVSMREQVALMDTFHCPVNEAKLLELAERIQHSAEFWWESKHTEPEPSDLLRQYYRSLSYVEQQDFIDSELWGLCFDAIEGGDKDNEEHVQAAISDAVHLRQQILAL